ncbi:retinoid-inducible serine carboxypeptidase-like isoform X2 [Eriocheir sinensis]|uniref:retinoid-inducible serine carboxypeptidase-like isoform X2 n=1 Tax=Eriocheir sinensis TaxID=95602 RepID=UPI0021C61535|nr:retinoid-inducible serine carboxypeptidase-like isoform X2 [Eriocheir sinensis]
MKVLLSLLALATLATASQGGAREQLQEDFGYVEVRPGAHMFWVMYHVDQPGNHTDFPLIMWLQGGPGASGVGYGNFMELGPYDINGNLREYAWTKKANVMFVDNPVGTGYSYVEDSSQLATDNAMIAADLVTLIKEVFSSHTHMQVMPFYVFAESYGGKMTVDFALEFDKAIKNGEVVSDFRGVGLGDSWISPMDSVNTWGTFLYQMGFVNQKGLQAVDNAAANTQAAVDAGLWEEATNRWSLTELVVTVYANNVNFYNVLAKDDIYRAKKESNSPDLSFMSPDIRRLYDNHVAHQTRDALGDFMNGGQADKWGIPDGVVWDSQGGLVFNTLAGDFMKPVVDSVVRLLTETTLDVVVFTGDLDLICDTPGTYRWIENMEWPDKTNFTAADNTPIYITAYSSQAATIQNSGQLSLYTIFRSGHMVPIDAPEMALKMLDLIFANSKDNKPQHDPTKHEKTANSKTAKAAKKEAVTQEDQPKQEMPMQGEPAQKSLHPKPIKLADLHEEALKEEAEKEKEAASQDEETDKKAKQGKEQQNKQERVYKRVKKQMASKMEKMPQKKTKKENKQENKKHEQKKEPKLEEVKHKVDKQVKQKQEKTPQQEQKKKKEAPKLEEVKDSVDKQVKQKQKAPQQEQKPKKEAPKQETRKQEAKEGGPLREVKRVKANILEAHQQQGHQRLHSPGPLPDPRRMRR